MALHLRYTWARFMSAALPAAEDVFAGRAALLDAAKAAAERFSSARLTSLVRLGGQAMAPTLNAGLQPKATGETLLVRSITAPSERCASKRYNAVLMTALRPWLRLCNALSTVFRGDVVTLRHPSSPTPGALLVRRVVALPGDEMVSDSPDDAPFVCVAARAALARLHAWRRSVRVLRC